MAKKNTLTFTVELDENNLPINIEWNGEDSAKEKIKALMISVYDGNEQVAKRVDLWTKDMYIEEMKLFYFQTLMTMADGFERSTGETEMAAEMRTFGKEFGKKGGVVK
ncbi:MAG: gliding motility protein GldC [Flavobacteriales bacterium]